jgi:hypothetical protein
VSALRDRRKLDSRLRIHEAPPIRAPELDREIEILAVRRRARCGGPEERLVTQRQRHLTQLVIEYLAGLLLRLVIDGSARDRTGDEHRAQQPDQQLAPDRFHGSRRTV